MPSRVKQYANVLVGLMFSKAGSRTESVSYCCVKVVDLYVDVHHHLLATIDGRPNRSDVLGRRLEAEIGDAIGGRDRRPTWFGFGDCPSEQACVEVGERTRVGCLEYSQGRWSVRCDQDNRPFTYEECLATTTIREWTAQGCEMKVFRRLFAPGATLPLVVPGTGTVSATSSSGLTCSGTFTAPASSPRAPTRRSRASACVWVQRVAHVCWSGGPLSSARPSWRVDVRSGPPVDAPFST
jgi:hypothetical protein